MGRYLVPIAMVAGLLGLATAALTIAAVPDHPAWWQGTIWLATLGGITPLIHAVNIRIVPVFSRRQWTNHQLLRVQVALALTGAWGAFTGRLTEVSALERAGHLLALGGGVVFTVNIVRLFRQPVGKLPAPPLPNPEQAEVDKIAIRFTRIAGMYMLVGLAVGAVTAFWTPDRGRWELVWAHTMLLGFFLSMASGVAYHVLARWTGAAWRSTRAIRLHATLTALALPAMLLALALDWDRLFLIAGPLQAAALTLFLANTLPLALHLPGISRVAWMGATAALLTGIGMGAAFAIEPAIGVRLRMAHAEINLLGWSGLLISAVLYYLAPRFAGAPLRWPRLAPVQVGMLLLGITGGALALGLRMYGHDVEPFLTVSQLLVAGSLAGLGVIVGATFANRPGTAVALMPAPRRPGSTPLPRA